MHATCLDWAPANAVHTGNHHTRNASAHLDGWPLQLASWGQERGLQRWLAGPNGHWSEHTGASAPAAAPGHPPPVFRAQDHPDPHATRSNRY